MLLAILILFPFLAAAGIALAGNHQAKTIALGAALAELLLFLLLAPGFDPAGGRQFQVEIPWVPSLGISFHVAMDGISFLLVLLTVFLVPLIILASFRHEYKRPKLFYALILCMQAALVGTFTALDAFLFYIFWELALVPIYLICLLWGGRESARITLKFFIYTLFGSLLMLVGIIYLYLQTPASHTFSIDAYYALSLDPLTQGWIFWAFFLAFAIKMPVFPFHTWQPDTYVDAPAPGTMLLSGIMLKMGTYGLIRWLLPVVPAGVSEWGPWALGLAVISVVYASCIALVQKDFKRLVAYSSIAHVGLIAAGIFTMTVQGLQGSLIQMLSHGVNVVGLFFIADILLSRSGTLEMEQMGGIRDTAPRFATMFLIIVLASVALPLTNGFIGEFLLLMSLYQYLPWVAAVAGLTIILGAVYMLSAYQKICLGTAASERTSHFSDLTRIEMGVLVPLIACIFFFGLYPKPLLDIAGPSVEQILQVIQLASAR